MAKTSNTMIKHEKIINTTQQLNIEIEQTTNEHNERCNSVTKKVD